MGETNGAKAAHSGSGGAPLTQAMPPYGPDGDSQIGRDSGVRVAVSAPARYLAPETVHGPVRAGTNRAGKEAGERKKPPRRERPDGVSDALDG